MSWRERWARWREEYLEDNPIAWLLGVPDWKRAVRRSLQHAYEQAIQTYQSLPEEEKDAKTRDTLKAIEEVRQLQSALWLREPVWRLTPLERRWLPIYWGVALILAWVAQAFSSVVTALTHTPPLNLMVMWLALALCVIRGLFEGLLTLKDALTPTGGLYVGMTRLTGAHVAYGLVAERLPRGARSLLFYIVPMLWVLGAAVSGSVAHGLWYALVCAIYTVALMPLLLAMSASSLVRASEEGSSRSLADWLRLIGLTLAGAVLFALLPLLASGRQIGLPANPLEWLSQLVWWVSLIPPLFIAATLWVEAHPLWGVPQIGLMAYLAWHATQSLSLWMERFRRLHETPQAALKVGERPGEWD